MGDLPPWCNIWPYINISLSLPLLRLWQVFPVVPILSSVSLIIIRVKNEKNKAKNKVKKAEKQSEQSKEQMKIIHIISPPLPSNHNPFSPIRASMAFVTSIRTCWTNIVGWIGGFLFIRRAFPFASFVLFCFVFLFEVHFRRNVLFLYLFVYFLFELSSHNSRYIVFDAN